MVRVQPGQGVRVGGIHLTKNTEFPDLEIASRMRLKAGSPITSVKIQNGTSRIRKFLIKKWHLGGRAAVRREPYNAAKNAVYLTSDVSEGARDRGAVTGSSCSNGGV